jgi:serine protease AprX
MTTSTPASTNEEVVAAVSPRSKGGVSLFETTAPITADNVDAFRSEDAVIAAASDELRKLGFRVLHVSSTTISIGGPRTLFQQVFGVELVKEKKKVLHDHEVDFFTAPQAPAKQLLQPPAPLTNLIEGVALAEPPIFFESPVPPLVLPDPAAYRYLLVPDDVALVLKATQVHKQGSTGLGIKVAMPDTGHYTHPFFARHGYRVDAVILGPGATNPSQDEFGHGTGESANIFANAPDAELIPVKMGSDTTGALNAAVTASPKVITNSWGYDIDLAPAVLDPYLKTLEAAVANAVANGIVVCFSAGNGHHSFPGSHPDVISVGGVMVNYPNLDFEASSYASSFDSSLYPGRHVPDLCGLVGRNVNGRAPLHMLPIQPGCTIDTELAAPSAGGGPADGTAPNDGWALFSGTSAASPQVAGIVALMLQKDPALTPAQVKAHLKDTATDVAAGNSAMGDPAGPGPDAATGAGLVNAKWAWLVSMGGIAAQFFAAAPELQAQMVAAGQMPRITSELVADVMRTLRSRR